MTGVRPWCLVWQPSCLGVLMGVKWMVAFVDFFDDGKGGNIDGSRHRRGENGNEVWRLAAIRAIWCRQPLGLVLRFG